MVEIIPEIKNVTLDISTTEGTYFYVNNTFPSGYFDLIFFENGTNVSISDVCYTDTNPLSMNFFDNCYGERKLNLSYNISYNETIGKYYKYNFYTQKDYLIIKYNVSNTSNILNITVNITEKEIIKPTDKKETDYRSGEKDSDGHAEGIIIIIIIIIVIPVVIIALIVTIVCICICRGCRKKNNQPMPGYYQPPMVVPPSNPTGYPMVTQAPPIQENLLYTKPE